jgi:septal ring factor EnvC (AmiA/AmiB activator)
MAGRPPQVFIAMVIHAKIQFDKDKTLNTEERIQDLELAIRKKTERIDALEKDVRALVNRLNMTRDQVLKIQSEALNSKPLDLRGSEYKINPLQEWTGGSPPPVINDHTRRRNFLQD